MPLSRVPGGFVFVYIEQGGFVLRSNGNAARAKRDAKIRVSPIYLGLFGACLCLLLVCGVSAAFADQDEASSLHPGPSLQEVEAAVEGEGAEGAPIELTNSQAAEQLPHANLDRGEALTLLSSVFGP